MREKINANRMELLNRKKRLVIARKGHKLLKDKQDELVRQFMNMVRGYRTLREQVENGLSQAFQGLVLARTTMSRETVEESLLGSKEMVDVAISFRSLMNVRIPELALSGKPDVFSYGFTETSADLDRSLLLFSETMPLLIELAQVERQIELLAAELERTRRRVNALEYMLIPDLEESIKNISMRLSEMERSFLTNLIKIKDIIRGH
ncbi:MAG: V-type ATP synthase subunit D [bacterium]